jgi:hypothetical protein
MTANTIRTSVALISIKPMNVSLNITLDTVDNCETTEYEKSHPT